MFEFPVKSFRSANIPKREWEMLGTLLLQGEDNEGRFLRRPPKTRETVGNDLLSSMYMHLCTELSGLK